MKVFKILQNKWMMGLIHKNINRRQSWEEPQNLSKKGCGHRVIPIGIICELNFLFILFV